MPLDKNGNDPKILMYSLALGVAVGVLYTVFRIAYGAVCRFCKRKKYRMIFRFALDIMFSLVYTLTVVVFVFGANSGVVRGYILLFAALGFLLYHKTLGRLVYAVLMYMLDVLFVILRKTVRAITYPIRICLCYFSVCVSSRLVALNAYKTVNGGIE